MVSDIVLAYILPATAFAMGACIGSFLNVVIYRVPNGLSVNEPRRSFCPSCKTQIPMHLNIPLFTWLMLGGKCKWCKESISFRYFLVELLTGIVFLAIWNLEIGSGLANVGPIALVEVVALWIFASLLIAATFIDIDHFIIPDSITIGGTVVGVIASFGIPHFHEREIWWQNGVAGLAGAAIGFGLLWLVVLMGKMMFGKIKHDFDKPTEFEISQPGGEEAPIIIKLGEHEYEWGDVFFRKWDRLVMDTKSLYLDNQEVEFEEFLVLGDHLLIDGDRKELEDVKKVSGTIISAVVPREAMGFGDVKFIAMIGAFLGWQAVLVTIFSASIIGAVVGLIQKFLIREEWSRPLPFGPYLALGAFICLFIGGPEILNWYFGLMKGRGDLP